MKKTIVIIFAIIIAVIAIWGYLRFVVGGDEDTWLCDNGQWVKHGVPSAPMPTSGCGETNTATSLSPVNSDGNASVVDYSIEMDEYSYSPAVIQVESGETIQVKLINKGNTVHDFVIDELDVNSGLLSPGEEKTVTITGSSTGSYSFYCSVGNHRQLGMEGIITVQ